MHLLCLLKKSPSKLPARSSCQSPPGRDPAAGDWPPAWQLRETLAISCPGLSSPGPSPPGRAAATTQYLRRSWARPHFARQNPNPCCGLPAGRPPPPARLRGAGSLRPGSGCRAQSVRSARRRRPGRCGLDCARRPRPGGGSAEASAARSPLPAPAGRCLREGSAGRRVGRAWREKGGERGGASGSEREQPAPRRPQTGVKYPGAVPLPLPAPGLGERGEVARWARPVPFSWVWPSLEDS